MVVGFEFERVDGCVVTFVLCSAHGLVMANLLTWTTVGLDGGTVPASPLVWAFPAARTVTLALRRVVLRDVSCWLMKIAFVSALFRSWPRSSCGWSSGRMCLSWWWLPSWRLPCLGKSWLCLEDWGIVLSTTLVPCPSRSDLQWSGLWCCSEYMCHCRIGMSWQALWGYRVNHRMFLLAVAYASWSFYVRQWRLFVPPRGFWVAQWWQLGVHAYTWKLIRAWSCKNYLPITMVPYCSFQATFLTIHLYHAGVVKIICQLPLYVPSDFL